MRGYMAAAVMLLGSVLSGVGAADVVTEWNDIALETISNAQLMSPAAARALAIVHAGVFDAVNAVERDYEPYMVNIRAGGNTSAEAAAVAAAHRALVSLFPGQEAALDAELEVSLAQIPDGEGKTAGVALGEAVADVVAAWRMNDGSMGMTPYTPGTDPGEWRPTPPGYVAAAMPHWGNVTRFATQEGWPHMPPPARLRSAKYAREVNQVAEVGGKNSTVRTAEQTMIAMFWMDMPGTITTVGRWNRVAQDACEGSGLSLCETARAFALLNLAEADAGIVVWECKYKYNFWRPVTAIREADTDGNRRTEADGSWEPLVMTPAFPEYTSAHSCFSAAAAEVLSVLFGRRGNEFAIEAFDNPMMARTYNSFHQAANEAGISRIYGGIHFPWANKMGLWAGRRVGEAVCRQCLKPARGRGRE